jgi:hypothetical protein
MPDTNELAFRIGFILAVSFCVARSPVRAGPPQVAWQEEFNDPASPKEARVSYEERGSGKPGDYCKRRVKDMGIEEVLIAPRSP